MPARMLGFTVFSAALLGSSATVAQADSGGTHLAANLNCSQMKQRLSSVQAMGVHAEGADATTGNPNPLQTNSVSETTQARHEIGAGDDACSRGDSDAARVHYQRAIDLLAVPH